MNQQLLGASNDQTDPTYTGIDTTGVSGSDDDDIKITARDIILQPFFKGDEEATPSADQSEDLARHHGKNDIFKFLYNSIKCIFVNSKIYNDLD